jgi:hypothetical protein
MEDSMCWEMDHLFFAEQEKAKKAEIAKEQRNGVIKNLLEAANNNQTESTGEAPRVDEVVSAK